MPGIRYVPEVVWQSKVFWTAIALMTLFVLLYHNHPFKRRRNSDFLRNLLGLFGDKSISQKVWYSSEGRSGHVHYQSPEATFAMYYEFGGGDCVTCIAIPGPENWEKATRLPLARREEVLNFIGQQVVKDQSLSGTGYFKIEGNWINIYI